MKNTSFKKNTTVGRHGARATARPKIHTAEPKPTHIPILGDSGFQPRGLFENMLHGFAYCQMSFDQDRPEDFIYLQVNSAFESLTGLKNVIGRKASEVMPGFRETDPELFNLYARVALTGQPERLETYVKTLKMWLLTSVYSPQRGTFVSVFDVTTGRKQADEALHQYVRRFEQAERHANLGSWEFDVTAGKSWWSKQMYRILYFAERDAVPGDEEYLTHIHPEDRPLLRDLLTNMSQGKESPLREFRSNPDLGPVRTFEPTCFIERDSQGRIVKFNGTLQDVTGRKQAEAALKISETRFRGMFEDSPISLWEEDFSAVKARVDALRAEGVTDFREYFNTHPETVAELIGLIRIADVNKTTMKMFGANQKEDILKNQADLFDVRQIPEFQNELVNIAEGQTSFGWDGVNKTLDGRLINIGMKWSVAPGYEDTLSRVIISMINITRRKRAEEELVAERDLLHTLINTLPDSVFIKDIDGRIIMDNEAHRRTLGAESIEQVVGKTDYDFHPPENAARYDADEKQVIRSGKPLIDKVSLFIYKDNRQRWFRTTKVPLRDRQGNITGIVGFNHDITERRLMEEELVKERNLLRTLIDHLPDAVYVKDLDGRFILKNLRDAQQMGASSPEETIGKTDFDYYSPELAAQYYADDQVVLRSGQALINREEPVIDAAGRAGWMLTTKVPLRDPEGRVSGLVGIGHDITERKQAEERIRRQLEQLAALRSIDQAITSGFDLHKSLGEILMHVRQELEVDAADVLLLNTGTSSLDFSAGVGFRSMTAEKASVRLDHSFAGRAVLECRMIHVPDLKDGAQAAQLRDQLADEDFVCYYGVPLMSKGSVKGVLEIFHRSRLQPDQEWLDFLNTLAGQAALAIDNAHLFENLQRSNIDLTLAYDATIEGWSHAMDLRDRETEGHTLRVTKMTMELAALFGIKDEELVGVRRGALLHDIGKMGVPDAILFKPSTLTPEEWVMMKKHPALAFEMLAPIRYLQSAIDIPYCHHEKWDGSGYPRGLKGEQIPLVARIFAVADVWDALTSDRPYRNAWPREKALEYLRSEAGKHFDPEVVKICLEAGVFDRTDRS